MSPGFYVLMAGIFILGIPLGQVIGWWLFFKWLDWQENRKKVGK